MKFAEITITIEVDETKLTHPQRSQVCLSEEDFDQYHPVTRGVEDLTDAIASMSPLSYFNYLKEGREAIKITLND